MSTQPIALTLGDPAGIGPEIIAKCWHLAPHQMQGVLVAGDVAAIRRAAALVVADGCVPPVAQLDSVQDVWNVPLGCIGVLQVVEPGTDVAFGHVSARAGHIAAQCVRWAARAALRGDVAAMVTAPLHKEALAAAQVPFPGHTELLQAEAAQHLGRPVEQVPVRMMLANDELRTVLVSIHVALRQALDAVTVENLQQTLQITHSSLSALLGRAPHIAVAGLNPHAGEGGLFGSEEQTVITPAIEMARQQGLWISGPIAPDTVFMRARNTPQRRGEFDVVVAMYHDQGLIPVKYLGIDKGVNVTLGLPLIRTSPDHGTAFDIAGTGTADPSSLMQALQMARSLSGLAL